MFLSAVYTQYLIMHYYVKYDVYVVASVDYKTV